MDKVFIPFMIGSISLVAYISLRNFYHAKAIRSLSDYLRKEKCDYYWDSAAIQLSCFMRRYDLSNYALLAAIVSVVCYGSMVALFAICEKMQALDPASWETASKPLLTCQGILMLIGGACAGIATLISLYEAYMARTSLYTAAASSASYHAVKGRLDVRSEVQQIAQIAKRYVRRDIYTRIQDSLNHLGETNPREPDSSGSSSISDHPE
ncbi:MAG: hypothetical protein AAF772_06800 [Acidobacteriota bacterium]